MLVISNCFYVNAPIRGKETVVLREITRYVSISQPFRILIGKSQNLLNQALRKRWRLGYFKCSKL